MVKKICAITPIEQGAKNKTEARQRGAQDFRIVGFEVREYGAEAKTERYKENDHQKDKTDECERLRYGQLDNGEIQATEDDAQSEEQHGIKEKFRPEDALHFERRNADDPRRFLLAAKRREDETQNESSDEIDRGAELERFNLAGD